MSQNQEIARRDFLKTAAAAGFTVVASSAVRGAAANGQIEVGLIGCGGRGAWIGELFQQHGNAKIVAVHDYFRDRADAAGEKLGVPADRRFTGIDGYRKLLELKLDGVAIISPPYFRPDQATASLAAGKHVYMAKPLAVDAPGCMAIQNAANAVKGKLTAWVDFQTRAMEYYQEAARRVHTGNIGKPVLGQVYYVASRLQPQAAPGDDVARMRNWVFDKALSGDIIVEQNIHVIDVANWMLRSHPLKAQGTGGRKARTDVGDCWDHFMVQYWYPDDVLVDFASAQFTIGYDDLCCRIFGTLGTLDTHYGGQVYIRAKTNPYRGGETRQIYQDGAIANIKKFSAAITSGQPINNVEESVQSNLAAILGRIAAYEGRLVTWDEMMQANTRLDAKLNLPADGPEKKA